MNNSYSSLPYSSTVRCFRFSFVLFMNECLRQSLNHISYAQVGADLSLLFHPTDLFLHLFLPKLIMLDFERQI